MVSYVYDCGFHYRYRAYEYVYELYRRERVRAYAVKRLYPSP